MSDSSGTVPELPALVTTGLIVVSVIFPILSLVSTYFRYKVRHLTKQNLGSDDWWLLVSWVGNHPLVTHNIVRAI